MPVTSLSYWSLWACRFSHCPVFEGLFMIWVSSPLSCGWLASPTFSCMSGVKLFPLVVPGGPLVRLVSLALPPPLAHLSWGPPLPSCVCCLPYR